MQHEKMLKNSSIRESKKMKIRITYQATKKYKKNKLLFCDNDNEEQTWPCSLCGESFLNNKPGEK